MEMVCRVRPCANDQAETPPNPLKILLVRFDALKNFCRDGIHLTESKSSMMKFD